MNSPYQKEIIQAYLESYNNFDVEGMMQNLHEDVEFINITGGEISTKTKGKDELRKLAEQSLKFFKSRNQSIINYESHENKIVIEVNYSATVAVDLPNGIKEGETVNLKGRTEFTFYEDKISSITDVS